MRAKQSVIPVVSWCAYDWLVMQHKLNCIGRLHTPISPVSHGHRPALSDARNARGRVCAWAGSAAARSPCFCMWQKLALREGYPFATRIGADRDDRQKYHPLLPVNPDYTCFLLSIPSSRWCARLSKYERCLLKRSRDKRISYPQIDASRLKADIFHIF